VNEPVSPRRDILRDWTRTPVDTVANVDVNIVVWYTGMVSKIIARDLRLVANRQYAAGITWPWLRHVQPFHNIIPLFRCRPPGLHKPVQE
jgi:hypothetical protein